VLGACYGASGTFFVSFFQGDEMIDYYEILSFCAFDVDRAHEVLKELEREAADGVERVESESHVQEGR
jgi:hypothetical protein